MLSCTWFSRTGLLAAGLLWGASAWAMDCAAAKSPIEQLLCRDPAALAADAQLGAVYTQLIHQHPDQAPAWRQDELNWLAWRDDLVWAELNTAATSADPAQARQTH